MECIKALLVPLPMTYRIQIEVRAKNNPETLSRRVWVVLPVDISHVVMSPPLPPLITAEDIENEVQFSKRNH